MTDQTSLLTSHPKRRWLRRLLFVFLVLAGVYVAYRYTLHCMVEAKLNEIRKQGYPVTLAELDKWYPQVPKERNAAEVYLEAFRHFARKQSGDTNLPVIGDVKLPPPRYPFSTEMKNAISEYLVANQEALNFMHRAAEMESARYPINFEKALSSTPLHLLQLKHGCRLLELEAIASAVSNEPNLVVKSIVSMMGLAHSLENEPVIQSHLKRIACWGIAVQSLRQAFHWSTFSDAQLTRLSAAFGAAEQPQSVARSLIGERSFGIRVFNMSARQQFEQWNAWENWDTASEPMRVEKGWYVVLLGYKLSGLATIEELYYLNAMSRYIELTRLPLHDRVKASRKLKDEVEARRDKKSLSEPFVFSSAMIPSLDVAILWDAREIAYLREASIALAIERFRFLGRGLPNRLDELAPAFLAEVPADPFDGQPVRYRQLTRGYVLYSVGEDGKDNSGDEKKDITFTVER